MNPIGWVLGTAAMYGAAWFWLAQLHGALRRGKGAAELAGIAVVTIALAGLAPVPFPWRFFVMSAAAAGLLHLHARRRVPRATTGPEWRDRREDRRQALLHLTLVSGGALFIIPFIWLVTTSLKEDEEIFRFPPTWIPRQQETVLWRGAERGVARLGPNGPTVLQLRETNTTWIVRPYSTEKEAFEPGRRPVEVEKSRLVKVKEFRPRWRNYADALTFLPPETYHGAMYLWNTVVVTVLNIAGVLLSSSLVGFSFARLRWPGRDLLFVLMLSTMMLPAAVTLIPVFLIYRSLGWVDTLQPLWVGSFFAAPFNVFLLRQFFLTIPNDLEDAAKIDGCSYFRIYWNIMLPLIRPALAALTIFAFMGSWNNFMGPLIYISSPEKMTLAYALRLFQSAHTSEYGMLMAASTLVMLPVLLVFFFTQRYFIEGVTLTGMKG